ncbi:MAG: hypothetical protein CME59_22510 [Halioglobus sp.]|nr:hypothetical protein [Halioglobus sp.]
MSNLTLLQPRIRSYVAELAELGDGLDLPPEQVMGAVILAAAMLVRDNVTDVKDAQPLFDALEEALEVATEIQFAQVVLRFRDTEASNG